MCVDTRHPCCIFSFWNHTLFLWGCFAAIIYFQKLRMSIYSFSSILAVVNFVNVWSSFIYLNKDVLRSFIYLVIWNLLLSCHNYILPQKSIILHQFRKSVDEGVVELVEKSDGLWQHQTHLLVHLADVDRRSTCHSLHHRRVQGGCQER